MQVALGDDHRLPQCSEQREHCGEKATPPRQNRRAWGGRGWGARAAVGASNFSCMGVLWRAAEVLCIEHRRNVGECCVLNVVDHVQPRIHALTRISHQNVTESRRGSPWTGLRPSRQNILPTGSISCRYDGHPKTESAPSRGGQFFE
jgi:hypothetical protein